MAWTRKRTVLVLIVGFIAAALPHLAPEAVADTGTYSCTVATGAPFGAPAFGTGNCQLTVLRTDSVVSALESDAGCKVLADTNRDNVHETRVAAGTVLPANSNVNNWCDAGTFDGTSTITLGDNTQPQPSSGTFVNYPAPSSLPSANNAGETSIGVDVETNTAVVHLVENVARVKWDDSTTPATAEWGSGFPAPTRFSTLDPILWTDRGTGRTFVAHNLVAGTSRVAYTDDNGVTWTHTQPPVTFPAFDHETIGGGPYASPEPARVDATYPNAVYYCAQMLIHAHCSRSDNGGLTWNPAVGIYTCLDTEGRIASGPAIHGHLTVAPDGTVYLPAGSCLDNQSVMVSRDNGLTWERHRVPGTTRPSPCCVDPVVVVDGGGRAYFVTSEHGRPVISVSDDKGATWSQAREVAPELGLNNLEFPLAVAGDAGRVAVAYLGTTATGDHQNPAFQGDWFFYESVSTDGGRTWTTTNVTPNDPVQRGCINKNGTASHCRNLLDFQGMTVDAEGRVLISYADGCISPKCTGPEGTPADSTDSYTVIARQAQGPRLYAAFDPVVTTTSTTTTTLSTGKDKGKPPKTK